MTFVSGLNSQGLHPLNSPERAESGPKSQGPAEAPKRRQPEPMYDEYAPEEPEEPSGRYRPGRDGDGRPVIHFDSPERAADAPKGPEEKKGNVCAGNTDKVDREIERLKKKRQELEQRLGAETSEARIKDLERKLAQVERELKEKDNDTYRRQHSEFTQIS